MSTMPLSTRDLRSAQIANFLKNRQLSSAVEQEGIQRRTQTGPVEASEEQRRIWLHAAVSGCTEMYNDTFSLRYSGELNVEAFESAFNEILKRHEGWRTSFEVEDDTLLQKVAPEVPITIPVTDLRSLSPKRRSERFDELIECDSNLAFTLTQSPLFRARLVRFADRDFRFILVIHHLISDGVSIYQIFLSEIQALYSAFSRGLEPSLPPLLFQYPDYAEWQRRSAGARDSEEHLNFWSGQLGGEVPLMKLPLTFPRPPIRKWNGGLQSFLLSKDASQELRSIGYDNDATLFMISLAAFHVLLYHYTGECDQVIGTVSSTRRLFGTDAVLGLFINVLPFRCRFSAEDTFPEVIRQVKETTLDALEHEVPLEVLVRRFGRRAPSITPFFQTMFIVQPPAPPMSEEWQVQDVTPLHPFAKFDLTVQLREAGGQIVGRFNYCLDIFDPQTIAAISKCWVKLLDEIAVNPDQTVRELSASLAKTNSRIRGLRWFSKRRNYA